MPDAPGVLILAGIVAGAIAAVSGFGIGSLLTPLLMLSFPVAEAVALVALPHLVATTIRWWGLRADVDRPTFRQFGIASATGGLAGALLQSSLGSTILTLLLTTLIVLAGSAELLGRRLPLPQTPFWRLTGGTLSGLFGGLVGNQGGIRAAALLGFGLEPQALVATATASALLVDLARVPVYVAGNTDLLSRQAPVWLLLTAAVVAGTLLGVPLLRRVPEPVYRRMIGALLVLLGVSLAVGAV